MKAKLCMIALWAAIPALAQQHAHHHSAADAAPPAVSPQSGHAPYAGMQTRTIKALSAQQIADLHAGKGMSLALAAELNGYPGPAHVLELAEPLQLSEEQKRRTKTLFQQMQSETVTLGESVIAAERELDRLFSEKKAGAASVQAAAEKAAAALGRLRAAHLRYHLDMLEVLTPAQVAMYGTLRGYAGAAEQAGNKGG